MTKTLIIVVMEELVIITIVTGIKLTGFRKQANKLDWI